MKVGLELVEKVMVMVKARVEVMTFLSVSLSWRKGRIEMMIWTKGGGERA